MGRVKFPLNESQPKMRAFVHPSVQRTGLATTNVNHFLLPNKVLTLSNQIPNLPEDFLVEFFIVGLKLILYSQVEKHRSTQIIVNKESFLAIRGWVRKNLIWFFFSTIAPMYRSPMHCI